MDKQIFYNEIKNLRLYELKAIITNRKWKMDGARVKSDFQKIIYTQSYTELQINGIKKLSDLLLSM
jgi:hypothetical protein